MSMLSENGIGQIMDLTPIQNAIDQTQSSGTISFENLVRRLIQGDLSFNLSEVTQTVMKIIMGDIYEQRSVWIAICIVGIISAVLRVICDSFENHQIADTGYYSMFLILSALMIKSFSIAGAIADATITNLNDFMKVMIPAFALSVGMASGETGVTGFYGVAMLFISIIMNVILRIVLPMIKIYVVLGLVNHISGGNYLKQLTTLIKDMIGFTLKTLIGLAIGMNMIQGMISPVIDTVKRGAVSKAVSMIPGVGGVTNSIMETVVGSAILIKNGVGIAGLLVMLLLCLRPLLQLSAVYIMYQMVTVILSPVAHKNMTESLVAISESIKLLIRAVFASLMLFEITIAIAIMSTSRIM